jgi:hypothetical protein
MPASQPERPDVVRAAWPARIIDALGWISVAVLVALLLVVGTGIVMFLRHGMPVPGGPHTQPTTTGQGFPP